MNIVFEPLARGLYLEALLVDGDEVWLSDVVSGGIRQIAADGTQKTWLPERRMVGGLARNAGGEILVSGGGGIVWFDPASGASGTLLDNIDGSPMGGVNEMRADAAGALWFGTLDLPAILRGAAPGPVGLYRLDADRLLTRLAEGLVFTNGVSPSADGKALFHNESFVGTFCYPVQSDGTLGDRTMLLDKQDADGMALDVEGMIWISGFASGELLRIRSDGAVIDRIPVPGDAATNVRFGGADMRDIYVTVVSTASAQALKDGKLPSEENSVLYKGRSPVAGLPLERTGFVLG